MKVERILSRLYDLGIKINVVDNKLSVQPTRGKIPNDVLNELKTNKVELIHYLKGEGAESKYIEISNVEKKEFYPLSSAQKRMYLLQQFNLTSTAYNMPNIIPLGKGIDKEKIEDIFKQLINRHESFRTSIIVVDEYPVQLISKDFEFEIEELSIEANKVKDIQNKFIKPFDLSKAPFLRAAILEVKGEDSLLMLDMHHIISDGNTHSILEKEFLALLTGEELASLPLQYKDYSEWQNSKEQQDLIQDQEQYWLNKFEGEIPVLNLPTDYVRPLIQSQEGAIVSSVLSKEETEGLRFFTKENDLTLYMSLFSVFSIFLSKLSGQEDIVVGSAITGRNHADLENIVGIFTNTLSIRNEVKGEETVRGFVSNLKQTTLGAYENQNYQFEDLVDKLSVERNTSRNPIFDVTINFLNRGEYERDLSGFNNNEQVHKIDKSNFDLSLDVVDYGDQLLMVFIYSTRLFKSETIDRFIVYFKQIINQLAEKPEIKISEIEILTEAEKQQLLYGLNNTKADYPKDKTIHQLFEEQVDRVPDNVALIFEHNQVTYKEINKRSNQLARILRKKGVGRDTIVGVLLDRSLEILTSILGILKAGGAYLPIDHENPMNRITSILEDSKATILLTNSIVNKRSFISLKQGQIDISDLQKTAIRPQITDFDNLPIPNRSLIDSERYNQYIGLAMVKNSIAIQGTRGCPYKCIYCHDIWPKKHFVRSAENIFAEVQLYYNMGVRRFLMIDDIFNLDRKNSTRFFQLIIDNGLKLHLNFPNGVRGDILTEEYVDLMVRAGTVGLSLALETGSPRLQKLIKKNLKIEKLRNIAEYISKKHPHVILDLFTMHGFPTETEEEALLTLNFIKSIKWIHFPYVHILKVYPNSEMADLAIKNGVSEKAIEKSTNIAYHELPETLPWDKSFTLKYQADFVGEYFLSKERLLHVLPYQMQVMTEDEIVRKYDSYLPKDIRSFDELLDSVNISKDELNGAKFIDETTVFATNLNEKLQKHFGKHKSSSGALKVLMLDASQYFSNEDKMLYDLVEQPLGLMYLLTYINEQLGDKIDGRIVKSRIDFDSYEELKELLDEFKPDVIGIRALSFYKEFFHKTISFIKQYSPETTIIAGGPYPTADYKTVLLDDNIDIVVLGEGELTFCELIQNIIDNGKKLPGEEVLKNIPGIAFIPDSKKSIQKLSREIVLLDTLNVQLDKELTTNLKEVNSPSDLAYVIFTSGSAGKPKGVMIEHKNVVRLLFNDMFQFNFSDKDIWTMFHSHCFDFSVWEMYGALLYGGKLVIVPKTVAKNSFEYYKVLSEEKVTVLNQTPSAFYNLAEVALNKVDKSLKNLRYVIFGGEALQPVKLKEWFEEYPDVKLINMYGITETTVHVTYKEIEKYEIENNISNIGTPIPTLTTYIVDKNLKLVPIGVSGELLVGGDGVCRGYLENEGLTKEKFIKNPYIKDERVYRSGDLVKMLPNGEMEYLGRIDDQIQLRGFRIECGEIENVLLNHENIKGSVVLSREDNEDKYLCAYIVYDGEFNQEDIREYLTGLLPDYMIPAYFVELDSFPLTTNGKVNRKALPLPEVKAGPDYTAPSNEIEKKFVAIWSKVLNIPEKEISVTANFFALGGHSLKATVLKEKIHKETGVEFALGDVFLHTTIKDQASHLSNVKNKNKKEFVPIPLAQLKEYYPLSTAQKRMYFLQQMDIESKAYNMPYIISLVNNPDKKKINDVIKKLINRHESLRTSFGIRGEEPVQFIHDQVEFTIEEYTIKANEVQNQRQQFIQVFDLTKAPLIRAAIVHIEGEGSLLMIDIHHIINDGASHIILEQDFQQLYSDKELAKLNLHYKDYAVWQDQLLKNKKYDLEARSFWNKYIGKGFPKMKMPYDYYLKSYDDKCNDYQVYINEEILLELQNLAQKQSTTLFTVVYSVFNILLSYFVGKEEVYCSVINSGRTINQIQGIVGCFANSLLVKNNLNSEKCMQELINDNNKGFAQLYSFQDFLYEEVLQEKGLKYPETSVAFNMLNFKESNETFSGKDKSFHKTNVGEGKFDLELYVNEYENGLTINWTYKNSLFKKETIEYIASCYNVLLENIVNNVKDIGNLKIDDIKRKILPLKTSRITPSNNYIKFENKEIEQNIISRFDSKVAKYGKNTAIEYHDESLTYTELHQESCQIANAILKEKSINNEGIALLFEQGNDMIKAMLGVLRSGNYYIPLDASYPVNWLTYILKDSGAKVLITNIQNKQKASELKNEIGENIEIINISNDIKHHSVDCPKINISPDSLAYILYTSGSTGFPKGVMQSHRNLLHYVMSYTNNTHISCDDKLTLFSSFGFAGSIQDIYGALLNGASLNIYNIKQEGKKSRIHEWIIQKGITIYHSTPTVYRYLLSNLEIDSCLNKIRLLVLGGEVVYKKDFIEYKKYFNEDCIFINCYGSTESPITAENIVNQSIEIGVESLPIGFGVPNTEVYVGKPDGSIALPFEEGEIIIKSKNLALGYLNNPEKTEESFSEQEDGRQMFKTGDIGRHLADLSIENVGRKDFQVKIRGYRVELGEVEGLLDRHPGIYKSVVHYIKQSESEGVLLAYYVLKDGVDVEKQELKKYIELHVPSFMIPNDFIQLDEFPYTLTGKIDRKSLPIPIVGFKDNYNEARTVTELKLAAIWAEILNVAQKEISVTSNFWDLGGNSFKALILIGKIYKDIGVEFPLQDIFLHATIRAQAIHISTLEKKDFIPIPKSKDQSNYAMSSAQRRLYFLQKLDLDSTAYNMPYTIQLGEKADKSEIQEVFQKLILRHESFRTSFELNGEEPVQIIHDHVDFKVENFKIEESEEQIALNKFTQVFDLSKAPLLRAAIVEIKGKGSLLMVDMHHIISDGVSRVILKQDFQKLYLGEDLPPLDLQYRDFSDWQNSEVQKLKVKKQEQYWINRFKGEIPALELPTDYTRPDKKSFEGATVSFTLSKEETEIIKLLTKENELTLYMSVLSVFNILLSKLSGQEDVIVGTPIAGRSHVDLENIVGIFVNTLVMRNEVKESDTLKEYLRKLKQNTLKAFENQDYQFEDLVEQVSEERDLSHNPIFNVVFNLLNQDEYKGDVSGLNNQDLIHNAGSSKFDLTLFAADFGDQLFFRLDYSTKLFKPETIEQFILFFKQIVNSKAVKISDINLTSSLTEVSSFIDQQDVDFEF